MTSKREKVFAIYAKIPELDCTGQCHTHCGPIRFSALEAQLIREKYGSIPAHTEHFDCNKLTPEKRCAIYPDRPFICRAFGSVGGMPCPYGCKPKNGRMSDAEARKLKVAIERIADG